MVEIYTDGSSQKNRSGYGVAAFKDNKIIYINSKEFQDGTNNQMELLALLDAFEFANTLEEEVIIYSDSSYCVNAINCGWLESWAVNQWRTSRNEPVKNVELMKQLFYYKQKTSFFSIVWVKGHNNNLKNELVDAMAVKDKKKFVEIWHKLFD